MNENVKYRIVIDLEYHMPIDDAVRELGKRFVLEAKGRGYIGFNVQTYRQVSEYKEIT